MTGDWRQFPSSGHAVFCRQLQDLLTSEEVGHGPKGIMVGRISESRTLFYRGHEINMAGF